MESEFEKKSRMGWEVVCLWTMVFCLVSGVLTVCYNVGQLLGLSRLVNWYESVFLLVGGVVLFFLICDQCVLVDFDDVYSEYGR